MSTTIIQTSCLTLAERQTLQAIADALQDDSSLVASDGIGVVAAIEEVVTKLDSVEQKRFHDLLRSLEQPSFIALLIRKPQRFSALTKADRERVLVELVTGRFGLLRIGFQGFRREASAGIKALLQMLLMLAYALPDASGQNPHWRTLGYPGPRSVPPPEPKLIRPVVPIASETERYADVAIAGTGPGGSLIGSILASLNLKVIFLEAGGYYNENDFNQQELWAYQHLYYRGGPTPTADGNVFMLAGGTLGGASEFNWGNMVRTPMRVLKQWAGVYGLEGLDTLEFDRHLRSVLSKISATDQTSDYNGPNLRLKEGCEKLAYSYKRATINADPKRYNPEMAGYVGYGDQTGCKQSMLKTYLLDAFRHGAEFIVRCRAERILVEHGRAAGVEATYSDETGKQAKVIVRAPIVVVACGALESPALLLRSKIGGPNVGKYLHLHPTGVIFGVYPTEQKSWLGWPQTVLCDEFQNTGEGHGFLIEVPAFAPGMIASMTPWASARKHKEIMTKVPFASAFIFFIRDRGHGRVTIDGMGNAVHTYELTDEVDLHNFRQGLAELIRLHEAAGALEIHSLASSQPHWKRGEDINSFIRLTQEVPIVAGAQPIFSAHQMSTCLMSKDSSSGVADQWGELHDVKGVWIGDASAFPTALGVNPMATLLALSHRTAEAITASRPLLEAPNLRVTRT